MNEQRKSKRFRGETIADPKSHARTEVRLKRLTYQRRPAEPKGLEPGQEALLQPARGLLICIGWLRLFRAIVPNRVPALRKSFAHEV